MFEYIYLAISEPAQRRKGQELLLPAGGHDYTFQYTLPETLPSSFESQDVCKGRVHYVLRARLDSPDENVKQSRDKTFIVLSMLDLNRERKCQVLRFSFEYMFPLKRLYCATVCYTWLIWS